ncbi:3-keto-disaccharide hydrolase [Zavarzinella formosa]|uniref:3-keto-disaccharide hydrolase n=1 Tax=Zavarzinella formosa TaxID=360055 RepID=UPI0003065D11|nr:DUF1080 domain-containing protein [Zavarzinella formosa]
MMKRLSLIALLAVLPLVSAEEPAAPKPPEGFTALFNGKDTTGWKTTGNEKVWGAEKGVIYVEKGGGGYLMTEAEYGDFEFTADYKLSKGANSGIALRAPMKGDPAYVGMEIQLIDDEGWPGKLAEWQHTGSIYNVVSAKKQANKPIGEWNTIKITCKGPKVTVILNGETLVDANLDEFKDKVDIMKKHPGLANTKGHLGFQSYNTRVEFKNVFLKGL